MTGFGQGTAERDDVRVQVELKGVNHRFLDVKMKLPAEFAMLETALRSAIQERVSRARIDVSVSVVSARPPAVQMTINRGLVAEYLKAVDVLKTEFGLQGTVGLDSVLGLPGAVAIQGGGAPADGTAPALVREALRRALDAYDTMRDEEGRRLADDIQVRLGTIREAAMRIGSAAAGLPGTYALRVRERVAQLLDGAREIDASRLAQEIALLAGRVDITEELVRLQGHLEQAEQTLSGADTPVGKTLDFIMQELNREANTMSSKAESLSICREALNIKAEVEKIREQVQNLE